MGRRSISILRWLTRPVAPLILLGLVAPAGAAVVNGSFETASFTPGWTSSGGAGVASAAFGTAPASGSYQALMETGPSTQSMIPALESFLGVPAGALNSVVTGAPPGFSLTEGSAIRQTGIAVQNGESISFSFNFLTDDTGGVSDTAFWTLSSSAFFLADSPTAPLGLSLTRFAKETGYIAISSGPLPAGTYILGFGVADYGDTQVDSGLLIDHVRIVPEPSTLGLGLVGLLALLLFGATSFSGVWAGRRRR